MLKIHYGLRDGTIHDVDNYFDTLFEPEWLESQLAINMIADVDKSEVASPYCINSPVLGQIAPYFLSGGVKALLIMLHTDRIVNASRCGDNCCKWIKKIGELKDLEVDVTHLHEFDRDTDSELHCYIMNTDTEINSYSEYVRAIVCLTGERYDR